MNKFRSHAEWPQPHNGVQFSEDDHETEEQAKSVCEMLERNGLGGDKKVFPIRTWVTPIN